MTRDQYMQSLDQDWADARQFIAVSDVPIILKLGRLLADEDASKIISWMQEDEQIADVVTRMALLAMHEATARCFDANDRNDQT